MDDDDIEIIYYGRNFRWVAVDGAKRMRANASKCEAGRRGVGGLRKAGSGRAGVVALISRLSVASGLLGDNHPCHPKLSPKSPTKRRHHRFSSAAAHNSHPACWLIDVLGMW